MGNREFEEYKKNHGSEIESLRADKKKLENTISQMEDEKQKLTTELSKHKKANVQY